MTQEQIKTETTDQKTDKDINDKIDSNDDKSVDATGSSETLAMEMDKLRIDLDAAMKNTADASDKMIRAHAEMENVRRRAERDVSNAHKFAIEKFAKELLPVIDSMEQACDTGGNATALVAMRDGVKLTLKALLDAVAKFGLAQIDPLGEPFDPEQHEAMAVQENLEMDPNTVMAVFQKGYLLNDRVIRPARVIVSRGEANKIDTNA